MNNPRVFLWIGLLMVLWLNYEAWLHDYSTPAASAATSAVANRVNGAAVPAGGQLATRIPQAAAPVPSATGTASASNNLPGAAGSATLENSVSMPANAPASASAVVGSVHVVTDVLDVDIGLRGGELQRADLLQYPLVKGQDTRVRLFEHDNPATLYLLQSGLSGPAGGNRPTHLAVFTAAANDYKLAANSDELRVPLIWTDGQGVTVTKTLIFRRGQYRVDLQYDVQNNSSNAWQAASYAQLLRADKPLERSMFNVETYAFRGPAYRDGIKYTKLSIDKADDRALSRDITGGWIAGMQHHFVSAVVPAAGVPYHYSMQVQGNEYALSVAGPLQSVASGAATTFKETLFVGPKLQRQLTAAGPELDRVADYGLLTLLSRPLFWVLEKLHSLVGNWGWAIIFATCLLKLCFYPLSEASGKSMAKMKVLAPRIKAMQESFKDDREKLGRAMMELYKKEKINPLAGCLPIVIQMPVFFAFYWVLLESVEMRQAPFMAWINDLSSKDPFFILPIIMAGAMFVQYKLNPTPPDAMQAKVFAVLPLVMSFTFAFFPAGLVLYWVTNTILSVAQQWNINRRIEAMTKKT